MSAAAVATLVLPGYGDSGPDHWQSFWEAAHPGFSRVRQRDWEAPRCADWVATLEAAVADAGPDTVLVAHSLGCLLVPHWAAQTRLTVKGALLVAPPDPQSAQFPATAVGFGDLPLTPLAFPSILVASSDDPYADFAFAQGCAEAWGSRLVGLGPRGHINAASGLGDWPEGFALVQELAGL